MEPIINNVIDTGGALMNIINRTFLALNYFLLIFFIFKLITNNVWAINSDQFEYSGYFRAGTGTNDRGGNHECFYNQLSGTGSKGNEFRLGNECPIYGEAIFTAHHLKGENNNPLNNSPFFRSQIRLAYLSQGYKGYEGSSDITGESDVFNLAEVYIQGGKFTDVPFTFWVGKRFYREPDLNMNDWFYFGNTVGNGAGVEDIPLGIGQLAFAQLRQVNTDQLNNSGSPIRTDVGRPGVTLWDMRLRNIEWQGSNKFDLWTGYAYAPGGSQTTSPYTAYEKNTGWVLGGKNRFLFNGGNYDFALIYGSGLMQTLELNGNSLPIENGSTQQRASRWRIVNDVSYEIPDTFWAFRAALTHERWDTGSNQEPLGTWTSVGILPVYFISEHIQLTSQLGASWIKVQSEKDDSGNELGQRILYRVTLAPQFTFDRHLNARPALRAYYTQSWWNKENRSSIATSAPTYAELTRGAAYGFQGEVWF